MEQTSQVEHRDDPEASSGVGQAAAGVQEPGVRLRIDPRTGKMLMLRDASFWREHDAERRRRGQSIVEYCAAHDLARSTFRRWATRFNREMGAASATESNQPSFLTVPIRADSGACSDAAVEVALGPGVTVKLTGEAAARAIETVLCRLGAPR